MCAVSVKVLEEVLAAEELTDEEVELGKEKARYNARRGLTTQQEVVVEERKDESEGKSEDEEDEEEDEDEDEPVHSSGLSAKAKGKRLVK